MTRILLTALAAFALLMEIPLRAGEPARQEGSVRLAYGIEWGYDVTFINIHHYNYLDPVDGFRVDDTGIKPMYYSNGHATAGVTLEFAEHFGVGIHAGYAGINQRTRVFPVALRGSYFFDSFRTDGNFAFLEGGAGFHESRSTVSPFGRLGYGRRARLSRRCSLDLSGSVRITADHPPIYDVTNAVYIDQENIRRSNLLDGALLLSIGLNF